MASNAYTIHLLTLLEDAEEIDDAHASLKTGSAGRQRGLSGLNRAAVVMCVSAWEAYVEELLLEAIEAIRPAGPAMGLWPALNMTARTLIGRFNNPNVDQIRQLFSDTIGLPDIHLAWTWRNCLSARAAERLRQAIGLRHEIAHGVHPRPVIHNHYSNKLPDFFGRLGRCTDNAVRHHLVRVMGIANPWPA